MFLFKEIDWGWGYIESWKSKGPERYDMYY
jgi:hypothetical protein